MADEWTIYKYATDVPPTCSVIRTLAGIDPARDVWSAGQIGVFAQVPDCNQATRYLITIQGDGWPEHCYLGLCERHTTDLRSRCQTWIHEIARYEGQGHGMRSQYPLLVPEPPVITFNPKSIVITGV